MATFKAFVQGETLSHDDLNGNFNYLSNLIVTLNPIGPAVNVAGTGSTAADATPMTAVVNVVTACSATGGVVLPAINRVLVVNRAAVRVTIYPPASGTIEGAASQPIEPGGSATFVAPDTLTYIAF